MITKTPKRPKSIASMVVVALLALTTPAWSAGQPNPRVLPPQSHPHGKSYGQWAAAWWQWVLSIPADSSPLFDETGANAYQGQTGSVWFLVGVFNATGTAERSITVPSGTFLFFPILNFAWISTVPEDPQTAEGIRALIAPPADAATDLAVEIDGVSLNNLQQYRTESPLFDVTLPEDNVFGVPGCECTFGPSMDQGYYLMVAPLSVGEHTLHFHGSQPDVIPLPPLVVPPLVVWLPLTLDITYHITVQ
jgi:hypothetical protein